MEGRLAASPSPPPDPPSSPSAYSHPQHRLIGWVVLGGAALAFLLLPGLFFSRAFYGQPSKMQCTCYDAALARTALEEYKANLTREDEAAAFGSEASLGPLERVVERQRQLILEKTAAIEELREAARAKDLGYTRGQLRQHRYRGVIVEEDLPSLWQQHKFKKHANFGFIAFSGYRISPTTIVVVGLGHLLSRDDRRLKACYWVGEGQEPVEGILGLESMEEHHRFLYELLLLNCTLPKDKVSYEQNEDGKKYTSTKGGYLEVHLDQEIFHPYREINGYEIHAEDSDGPFPFETLVCGPPMFGDFSFPSVTQWISYHRYHADIQHFILYDSGAVTPRFRQVLSPLIQEGLVTLTDFKEGLQYDFWAQSQAVAQNDCLFRTRNMARWVFFHDLDEYLEAVAPLTIPALLQQHRDKPYILHGCVIYSVDNCEERNVWDPQHKKFAVELLLWRWERPYCTSSEDPNMCLNYHGHRKMILNPRKILSVYVHVPGVYPMPGGVDMPVAELRHAHYRTLFKPGRPCSRERDHGEGLKEVTSVAEIAAWARVCEKENFLNEEKCRPHSH